MLHRVLAVTTVLSLAAAVGATAAALQGRERAGGWMERAIAAERDVADERAKLAAATEASDAAAASARDLEARVGELANEKAVAGDEEASAVLAAERMQRIAQAYADVTATWASCVKAHEQLVPVLEKPQAYDAKDTIRFKKELEALCNDAEEADAALRAQLAG
jgi:hypothetical protein